jgi:hypothetical protein
MSAVTMPSDALLGRVMREYTRKMPSPFSLKKAKSLAMVQSQHGQTTVNVGTSAEHQLVIQTGKDQPATSANWLELLRQFRVFYHAYVLVGFSATEGTDGKSSTQTTYCSLDWANAYLERIEQRAISGMSMAHAVIADHETRVKACELLRNHKVPEGTWSAAMDAALQELIGVWLQQPQQDSHSADTNGFGGSNSGGAKGTKRRAAAAQVSSDDELPAAKKPKKKTKSKGKGAKSKSSAICATATKDSKGETICKRHNDRRGCTFADTCRMAHVCDVLVGDKACASKKHTRLACPKVSSKNG